MILNRGLKTWFLLCFLFGLLLVARIYLYICSFSKGNAVNPGGVQEESTDLQLIKNLLLQERLDTAESIWEKSVQDRHSFLNSIHLGDDPKRAVQGSVFWDHFYATFDCPFHVERIGRVGDGGKWVCRLQHLITKSSSISLNNGSNDKLNANNSVNSNSNTRSSCVVYSFGVENEVSYEEEILSRTTNDTLPCIIHLYDPTINPTQQSNVNAFLSKYKSTNQVIFHKIGLGGSNDSTKSPSTTTLGSLMAQTGHDWIDILKIDIEGSEFEVLKQIIQEFGVGKLPFGQLQVELHLDKFKASTNFLKEFKVWFELLESAGLRPFHREPNYAASVNLNQNFNLYFEYSFINVKNQRNPLLYA